jgi:uncharacterized protein (DUF2235 family)
MERKVQTPGLISAAIHPQLSPLQTSGLGPVPSSFQRQKRNLVLCFDGTGNQYRADGKETNILKIFRLLEKDAPDQCEIPA